MNATTWTICCLLILALSIDVINAADKEVPTRFQEINRIGDKLKSKSTAANDEVGNFGGFYEIDDSGKYIADETGMYHNDGRQGRWLPDERGSYQDDPSSWRYVPDESGKYVADGRGLYEADESGMYHEDVSGVYQPDLRGRYDKVEENKDVTKHSTH